MKARRIATEHTWLVDDWFVRAGTLQNRVDLLIADPPYGCIVAEYWDAQTPEASFQLYKRLGATIQRVLKPGGTAYVWGGIGKYKNRPFFKWLSTIEEDNTELTLRNVITWSKKRAYGKKDDYLFTREECAMIVRGERPRTFNIPLLDTKRGYDGYNPKYKAKSEYLRRTNVWTDITEILRGKDHPTQKPERLAEIMIETSSNPGDLVVEAFAGSGHAYKAAQRLGRSAIAVESDPQWSPKT